MRARGVFRSGRSLRAWFAAVVFWSAWAHAEPFVVGEGFREATLGLNLELAHDQAGSTTIDDVLAGSVPFEPSTKDVPSFGYRTGVEWARFTVRNERTSAASLVVVHPYGQTDELDATVLCAGRRLAPVLLGDHRPVAAYPNRSRFAAFGLEVAPAESCTVVVRLQSTGTHQIAISLRTRERFDESRAEDLAAETTYFGALAAMAVYNLLVFLAVRDRLYLFYVAFLACYAIFQVGLAGLGHAYLWPGSTVFVDRSVPAFIGLVGVSSTLFTERLFAAVERPTWLRNVARFVVGALLVHQPVAWFGSYRVSMKLVISLALVWALTLIANGVVATKRGSRVGAIFLAAWIAFILGTITNSLRSLGVVPTNGFTTNAQQLGSVLEFLLLSFALADRIKQLQAQATRNAELAAANAELAREATAKVLEEQERANAELKRLDKLKDEFLANTSHELRTPLNGVIGLTEAVLKGESALTEASKQRLDLVLKSGRRLSTLVNDILDFSKLQRGEFEVQSARFELAPVVREVLETLGPSADQKGLRLRPQVPEGLHVVADASRVKQILTNLVGNAIKFTERGGVRVEAAQLGGRVLVRVADTGVGIAKEAQERIFVAFEQADGSTARKHGGTGLGLTVTKQLVELHGGTIRVESAGGKGSAFTFDLEASEPVGADSDANLRAWEPEPELPPRAVSDAPPMDGGMSHTRPSVRLLTRELKGVRLLVADDDPVNIEVLRAILEPAGYTLVSAIDGKQAVARAYDSGPFDAVLLDVMMPKMTGLEAATAIRADFPQGTLPILMLTAKNRVEDVVAGLAAGADDYLAKPVNSAELLARLGAHIEGLRALKAVERLISPGLVELAEVSRASMLERGKGTTRAVGMVRLAFHGLEALSARVDERTLFLRYHEVIGEIVTGLRDHGAVVESVGDHQLSFLVPAMDESFVGALERVIRATAPKLGTTLRLSAVLHHGPSTVGVLGDAEWVTVRALGESVYLAGALASWAARRGFRTVLTDACLARFHERPPVRRVGTARFSSQGHAVTVYEAIEATGITGDYAGEVDLLEKGRFDDVLGALADAPDDDVLVRYLKDAANEQSREVLLGVS